MNKNYIGLGDSLALMKTLPDNSINLIITSPPYWNAVEYANNKSVGTEQSYDEYIDSLLKIWIECERVLVPNGKLCINTPIMPIPKKIIGQHTRHIKNINNDIEYSILSTTDLNRYSLYIWQKQTSKLMFGSYPYPNNLIEQNTTEFINVFVKEGKPIKRDKAHKEANKLTQAEWIDLTQQIWFMYPQDVSRKKYKHPAPFPEKLPARLIKMFTYGALHEKGIEGDTVLDPFCGIGTTCVVAKKMNRNYIGFDIAQEYVDICEQRLQETKATDKVNCFVGKIGYKTLMEQEQLFKDNERINQQTKLFNASDKKHSEIKHKTKRYGRGVTNASSRSPAVVGF